MRCKKDLYFVLQRPIFYINKCKTHHLRTTRHLTKANAQCKGENITNNKPGSYMATRFHLTPRPPPSCYTIMSRNACLLFGTILLTPTFSSFSPGGRLEPVVQCLYPAAAENSMYSDPLLPWRQEEGGVACYRASRCRILWSTWPRACGVATTDSGDYRLGRLHTVTESAAPGGVAKRAPLTPSRYLMTQVHARVYWTSLGV